jgi:hypothetical protein
MNKKSKATNVTSICLMVLLLIFTIRIYKGYRTKIAPNNVSGLITNEILKKISGNTIPNLMLLVMLFNSSNSPATALVAVAV